MTDVGVRSAGMVQLYCNPATSEVSAERRTLHEAIDIATPSTAGALLICDGVILATAAARGWLFEQTGIERLHNEMHAAASIADEKKHRELTDLIEACIGTLEQLDLTFGGHELLSALRKAIGKDC